MDGARIIIVGGGAIGLSIAWQLGRRGAGEVLVLERNELTSGTSWHAAGIIGPLRATLSLTHLALRATRVFPELERQTGQATGYVQSGGLWLAGSEDRRRELAGIAAVAERVGLTVAMLDGNSVNHRFDGIRHDDLSAALWVAEDGQANPVDVCMAYARGARDHGVRIEQGAQVVGVRRRGRGVRGVVLQDGRELECETLILCAGAWTPRLGRLLDVALPIQAVAHMYVVTEPMASLPAPCPIVRDLDAGIYFKGDAGRLVLGGFEPDPRILDGGHPSLDAPYVALDEDWEQFEPFMRAALHRLPGLESVGIQHFMNGPEGFTPDTLPLVGPVPGVERCFVAAGFNSLGIVSSAGVGEALAEWVLEGQPSADLCALDPARLTPHAGTPRYLRDRMREAVADQFRMHWPGKQPATARGVCRTPLHEALERAGAVFGNVAGWERPLWFGRDESERSNRYAHGAQFWWPMATREGRAAAGSVALFDLSPFTKLDVHGPDALALLQKLCVSDMGRAIGRACYTLMLNERAGIEAEVIGLRTGESCWRLLSGAVARRRLRDWLLRHAGDRQVSIRDVTSAEAVLGLAGPQARALLSDLSDGDLSAAALPYGWSRVLDLGMAEVRVLRLAYAGELGFEIHCPTEVSAHVLEQLCDAGRRFDMQHAGLYCLDGCRLEKGHVHWSHDIGPADDPLEAGLGWCVDWRKESELVGARALAAARERGPRRRRVLLEVAYQGEAPLLVHDQLVTVTGRPAGMTTSGGLGPRTGKALAMAWLDTPNGESLSDLAARDVHISVFGERRRAQVLQRAPYDASGERMRS